MELDFVHFRSRRLPKEYIDGLSQKLLKFGLDRKLPRAHLNVVKFEVSCPSFVDKLARFLVKSHMD